MGFTVAQQTWIFLYSVALGAAFGVLYDAFRIFRIAFPFGRIAVFAEDAVFWLICAAATSWFLMLYNSGELRAYVIVGEFLGAAAYYFTVGELVFRMSKAIIAFIKRVLRWIWGIVTWPVRTAAALLVRMLTPVFKYVGKTAESLWMRLAEHIKKAALRLSRGLGRLAAKPFEAARERRRLRAEAERRKRRTPVKETPAS